MTRTLALACLLALCGACSSIGKIPEDTGIVEKKPPEDVLTAAQAAARAKQIRNVRYKLEFTFERLALRFQGKTRIGFELLPGAEEIAPVLRLDFAGGGEILDMEANGTRVAEPVFNGAWIDIPVDLLKPGHNTVEIAYSQPYSNDGNGLYRFADPEDGKVYLYTNLEPYHAHHVFPAFDQPDLKSSYAVTVTAPPDWKVITNTLEIESASVGSGSSRKWTFPPSATFSTYVFALAAGPFEVWKDKAHGIPLRLFARKALAGHIDEDDWFKVTSEGLGFFNREFGYPYPYGKYDQIIVPDFNAGAMENVAAVTFSERYVYRSKVTDGMRMSRAEVILHEMAHMWFGNLVTMKWWNGLWLNESFASFAASLAADGIGRKLRLPDAWEAFFSDMKRWAYWEDQLVTTHPIEVPVPDTAHAFAIFDGITYGKGASSLKQLHIALGEKDFRRGLQIYFRRFANGNTTLADFMSMLGEASGRDLREWREAWLETAGVNTLKARWSCEKGRITRFALLQARGEAAGETGILRPHRTRVALYDLDGNDLEYRTSVPADYAGEESAVPALEGKRCPEMVFPNHDDHDYVKVVLDPVSLKHVKRHLSSVSDTLTRHMIWHTLWEMVLDGRLAPQAYAETALEHVGDEKNELILETVLGRLSSTRAGRHSVLRFLYGEPREEYHERFEKFFYRRLKKAKAGSDAQLAWYQAYLRVAHSKRGQRRIRNWHRRWEKLAGLKIDQERRWELIIALARRGYEGIDDLIEREVERDPSTRGRKLAIMAEVSRPSERIKKEWLERILRHISKEMPLAELKAAMRAYHVVGQEELSRTAIEPYFRSLPVLARTEGLEYLTAFTSNMFPPLCDPALIERVEELFRAHPELPAPVVKELRVQAQEVRRCVRAQQTSAFY